jgi:uncharacterized membrane protein YdbT with pleckstrin-like domain
MASYVETTLLKGESVQYEGKVSVWSLLPKIAVGLVLIPLYGVGLLLLVSAAIRYYTTELAITDRRVIAKFGLIRRSTIEINLSKVETIQVDQSILARIFNFGNVLVAGAGSPQTPIPGISNPLRFRRFFFETQERGDTALAA